MKLKPYHFFSHLFIKTSGYLLSKDLAKKLLLFYAKIKFKKSRPPFSPRVFGILTPEMKIAVVCSSNQNRSMEAQNILRYSRLLAD